MDNCAEFCITLVPNHHLIFIYLDCERAIRNLLAAKFNVQIVVARIAQHVKDVEETVLFDDIDVDIAVPKSET